MRKRLNTVKLVAIVGGSGAGKSWLCGELRRRLRGNASGLSLDDFYRDRSHLSPRQREGVNYDHPRAIDWRRVARVLADCRAGRPTLVPRYDFRTHTRVGEREGWRPRPIVLVEGLWLLRSAAIRRLFGLRIFIDCPERVRRRRRLRRDVRERGRDLNSVRRRFREAVALMHRRFVAPQERWADVVLRHPVTAAEAIELADRISDLLEAGAGRPVWKRATLKAATRSSRRDRP